MSQNIPTWFDPFFSVDITDGGAPIPKQPIVDFEGAGVSVSDDPSNGRTKVTITGASVGQQAQGLSNGLNSNVATNGKAVVRVTGPTAAYSIDGFAWPTTPVGGERFVLVNTVSFPLTIVNQGAGSAVGNRIQTLRAVASIPTQGGNIVLPTAGSSCAFVFDATANRWVLEHNGTTNVLTFNAKDFGATGDGTTDDTLALTAAIAASVGNHLYLPSGTYNTTASLTVPSNTSLSGNGRSTRIASSAVFGVMFNGVTNASVRDLIIDMLDVNHARAGVDIEGGSSYITVENCHLLNCSNWGIVVRDLATSGGGNGINLLNNLIDMSNLTAMSFTFGPIALELFPKGVAPFVASPGFLISGNTILGTPSRIFAGIKCESQDGARILGNWVKDISCPFSEGGIIVANCLGAIVEGNHVESSDLGIVIAQDVRESQPSQGTVVGGNTITSYTNTGIFSANACLALVISNNYVDPGTGGGTTAIGLTPPPVVITGAVSGAGGQIQITAANHDLLTEELVTIAGVTGTVEANGDWIVTYVDINNFLLTGSTFVHAYAGGGTSTAGYLDLIIEGNVLHGSINVAADAPSHLVSGNRVTNGGIFMQGQSGLIQGNALSASVGGIQAVGLDAMVTGNSINGTTANGIILGANGFASGNKILDANTGNSGTGSGIHLSGDGCQVLDNHVENRTAAGLAKYGLYADSHTDLIQRDNKYVAMVTGDVFTNAPNPAVVPRAQELYADHTVSPAGADTNEDTLKTHTFHQATFGIAGGFTFKAGGNTSGAGGNKTIKAYWGGVAFVNFLLVANPDAWMIEGSIFNAGGEAAQRYELKLYINGALSSQSNGTLATNTATTAPAFAVTGQKGAAGDVCDCSIFELERFE